jgi:hypothetical protein
MKRAIILGILTAGAVALWLGRVRPPSVAIASPPPPAGEELRAITLVFGQKDREPTHWDGSAALSAGSIERIAGYHFAKQDTVSGREWQCSSHPWPGHPHEMYPSQRPQPHPYLAIPVGVTIYYRAPADAEMRINMGKQGEFAFRPSELPEIESIYPMRALVEVRRSPIVETLSESQYEDDYPSIAVDGGRIWVAWQAYRDKADRIFLRANENGRWAPPLEVTEKPSDVFMTGLAAARGGVTVVWSEREGSGWNLKARTYDGSRFGPVESVTTGDNNNLWHRVTADRAGNVHVTYQSWRKGRSDIYLRSREGGKWMPEILLSDAQRDARADDWDPAVVADRDGTVWTAWDGYATGSYNLYLRPVRHGRAGAMIKVTDTTRFHAHPSLAVDAQNRLWLAYDEAPENWGKDLGFLFSGGTGLYESRAVKVAVYAAGRWQTPLRQPESVVPDGFHRYVQTPRLAGGSDGRMWLFLRPRTEARFPASEWAAGGKWEVCATYYSGDRWSDLIMLPDSQGRDEGELAAATDQQGNAFVALVGDHQLYGGPDFGEPPGNNDILFTRLRATGMAQAALGDRPPEPPGGLPSEPQEKQQIARIRNYQVRADGRTYKIYRGEMHRHTEISLDGAGDGTLWDAYRYGMNAADLDFLVVTDHQSGGQEYTWWRIEKASDMFHVPGYFTAIYGTERSVNYPNGHRNLLYAKRGVPILDIAPAESQGKVNSGSVLYPFLKQYNGIATSHSSHTVMGTDWRDNDPSVEPIVELWEGSRTSAEHEGAPLAPSEKKTELWAGQYRPLGFVWNAWAKGYKLGVQASSDHISTHLSYTGVLAEGSSREALIDAMRKRHTYAATTNILMDYRMKLGGETYIQGDEAQSRTLPEISATIIGTGPLDKVVIVRDNQYIYAQEPQGDRFELRYRESSLAPGRHYYYVRMQQKDKHMAWSSPIWVNYTPNGK